jgi:hypothetical protein
VKEPFDANQSSHASQPWYLHCAQSASCARRWVWRWNRTGCFEILWMEGIIFPRLQRALDGIARDATTPAIEWENHGSFLVVSTQTRHIQSGLKVLIHRFDLNRCSGWLIAVVNNNKTKGQSALISTRAHMYKETCRNKETALCPMQKGASTSLVRMPEDCFTCTCKKKTRARDSNLRPESKKAGPHKEFFSLRTRLLVIRPSFVTFSYYLLLTK